MATKFRTIREKMDPERQERIRKRTQELLAELPLQELRQARALSQQELAEVLGLNQATVSKLERRTDMYLSSLRRFVEAMGGELEISASFPDGKVRIQLFEDLEEREEGCTGLSAGWVFPELGGCATSYNKQVAAFAHFVRSREHGAGAPRRQPLRR